MSKTKKDGLNHYEILFIVPNKFTEKEAKEVITKTQKILTDNSATITFDEYWGKKKLSYPIDHNGYGYYSLFEFDLDGINLAKINEALRMDKEIMRFQIVKMKKRTAEEIRSDKEKSDKLSKEELKKDEKKEVKKEVKEEKVEEKKEDEKKEASTKEDKKKEKEVKKDSSKADLKELDEKLEGILDAKDLL